MLNDLDQRGMAGDPDELAGEYNPPTEAQRIKKMVLFIGLVLLIAAAYFGYRMLGKDYFVDLYVQLDSYISGDDKRVAPTKKVSSNPALDEMMPARRNAVTTQEPQVASEVGVNQTQEELAIAQATELLAKVANSGVQNATNTAQTNTPNALSMIPQERTKRIIEEDPAGAALNSSVTNEIEPESASVPGNQNTSIVKSSVSQGDSRVAELNERVSQAISDKNPTLAVNYLKEMLSIQPKDPGTRKKIAVILYSNNDINGAKSILGDGINLMPERVDFRLMLARIYFKENNFFEVYELLEPLEPAIERQPQYYALKASAAKELNYFAEASHLYGKLALHEPDRAQWWLGLAVSLDKSGEAAGAIKAYERASDLRQLSASAEDFIKERILALGG